MRIEGSFLRTIWARPTVRFEIWNLQTKLVINWKNTRFVPYKNLAWRTNYVFFIFITIDWVIFAILVNNCWPNVDLKCSKCWLKVCKPPNSLDYFIKTIKEWYEFVTFLSQKMSSQVDIRQETFELHNAKFDFIFSKNSP